MDIKTQILKEAEKRYPNLIEPRPAFIAGAEWLDTEIVQPLRKENEGLKALIEKALEDGFDFGLGCAGICTGNKESNFYDNWKNKHNL